MGGIKHFVLKQNPIYLIKFCPKILKKNDWDGKMERVWVFNPFKPAISTGVPKYF